MSSLTLKSEKLPNGWYKRQDFFRLKAGRYCDKCQQRIPEKDIYYTRDEDPHTSTDYCETCYETVK